MPRLVLHPPRTVLALGILAACLACLPVAAQPLGPMLPPDQPLPLFPQSGDEPSMLLGILTRGAGLTKEQRQQVAKIMDAHRERLDDTHRRVRTAQDELAARMCAPGALPADALAPDVERLAAAHRARLEAIVGAAREVRGVLTPEQLARAAAWTSRLQKLRTEIHDLFEDDHTESKSPR